MDAGNDNRGIAQALWNLQIMDGSVNEPPESDNFTIAFKSRKTGQLHKETLPWIAYGIKDCIDETNRILDNQKLSKRLTGRFYSPNSFLNFENRTALHKRNMPIRTYLNKIKESGTDLLEGTICWSSLLRLEEIID